MLLYPTKSDTPESRPLTEDTGCSSGRERMPNIYVTLGDGKGRPIEQMRCKHFSFRESVLGQWASQMCARTAEMDGAPTTPS